MSKAILRTKQLSKQFGKQKALDRVTLAIPENSVYGLLGANGAGKSTLLKTMTGILTPTAGSLYFDGHVWSRKDLGKIGSLIETPPIYENLTARENLKVRALMLGVPESRIEKVLQTVDLTQTGKKKAGAFSLGMKQRLGIATALLGNPKLLILDEPTNGLDPIGIAEVRNFIKDLSVDRGKTILISSHILSEIALLADDIGIIDHGVLLEESSMEDLEKKNRKYIQLQVSDVPKASLILERQFHVTDYAVQDEHNLRLYDTALDMAAINKALVVQDVAVISSQICNDTLEDYFKQITGGEGIA